MGYRHVLLASDLSATGEWVALRAAYLARRCRARLTLLHVIEHFPEEFPDAAAPPENVDPARFFRDRARIRLAALAKKIRSTSAKQHVILSTSSARHEIVRAARSWRIDLIVLGSGESRLLRNLLGSTAASVLNHAPCDVIAVRSGH